MFQWQPELFCIMDWFYKYLLLQWSLAGVLLGVGFIFPLLWVLGIVGGAYFLYLTQYQQANKMLYLGAWWAWTIKTAAAAVWFWSAYPIEWLPNELGKIQLLLIGGYWFTASACLGVGGIVVALAIKFGRQFIKSTTALWGLVVPVAWVVGEVTGSVVFSIVSIGPGGSINSSLSFGYSGYLLAESDWLLQFAKIAGVYSLSFLFAVLALFLLHLIQRTFHEYKVVLVVTLVLFLVAIFIPRTNEVKNSPNTDTGDYSVVTIDTSFPVNLLRNRSGALLISEELSKAMEAAIQEKPDYIILPEDARFFNQSQSPSVVRSFFQFQYQNPETVIIDSGRANVDGETVLQTFIYTGHNSKVEQIHKRYLVPQGEFISSVLAGILRIFGINESIKQTMSDISYVVGPDTNQSAIADSVPGVLFCFESVAPLGVRTLINERPNIPFVAHQMSHAWFHDPYILWHELDTMLKVQAVWNQKYIISAGSHIEGKITTPQGKLKSLDIVAEGEMWKVKKTTITDSQL